MTTSYYEFTGTCKWAKVWPGQIDRKYEDPQKGGKWGIIVNLSPDDAKLYNSFGTKTKAVRLADPERGKDIGDVNFRRDERNKFGDLGAPVVSGVPEGTAIGNGSKVTVKVEVYSYTYNGLVGSSCRLVSVKVLDLVEYQKPETNGAAGDEEGPPVF